MSRPGGNSPFTLLVKVGLHSSTAVHFHVLFPVVNSKLWNYNGFIEEIPLNEQEFSIFLHSTGGPPVPLKGNVYMEPVLTTVLLMRALSCS